MSETEGSSSSDPVAIGNDLSFDQGEIMRQ